MVSKVTALCVWSLVGAGSAGAAVWFALGSADDSSRQVDQVIGVQSGTHGADGSTVPPRNTIENIRRGTGSIEPINRQEGVTVPMLQNLEVVLRLQSRTPPPPPKAAGQGGGQSTAAAKLLMMETKEPPPEEEVSDDRAIDAQFRQETEEGS